MAYFKANLLDITEDINVEVGVGGLKLLTSGLIFSISGEPINILIDDVEIEFLFEELEGYKSSFKTDQVSTKKMRITLINFENGLGQGVMDPVNYLFTDKFNIFLSFFVHTVNKKEKHRQFSYSIYYGLKK